jgi:formylglycine-generating enzyme required for sulfatase activity
VEDEAKIGEVLAVLQKRENSFLKVHVDKTVDITHESLIWKWHQLRDWLEKETAGAELYRYLVKDTKEGATWGEPKLSEALAVRYRDAWNEAWARQYSESSFDDVLAFLERSRKAVRNQKLLRWFGAVAAVALVILGIVAYYQSRQALQKARELEATNVARDGLAKDIEKRKQNEGALQNQIAGLNAAAGATKEERDRIAKQKSDLEARLQRSQEDSQKLDAQAKQSTNLLATVKSLQSRLDQAQRERDDAVQGRAAEAKQRQDAESKAAQVQAQVNSLMKELESVRASVSRLATPPKGNTPAPTQEEKGPSPQQPRPQQTAKQPPIIGQRAGEPHVNSQDGLTYVWIPPGRFMMGCSQGDKECQADEKPAHPVTITKGFWMGQTPVTQEAYERVIRKNPSESKGPRLPVEPVDWYEAQAYCAAVGMRLPTEAEWEYAARAGSPAPRYGNLGERVRAVRRTGERTAMDRRLVR